MPRLVVLVAFEVQEGERFVGQAEETAALPLLGVPEGGLGLEGGRRAERVFDAAAGPEGQDADRAALAVKEAHGHADGIEVVGVRSEKQDPACGGNTGGSYREGSIRLKELCPIGVHRYVRARPGIILRPAVLGPPDPRAAGCGLYLACGRPTLARVSAGRGGQSPFRGRPSTCGPHRASRLGLFRGEMGTVPNGMKLTSP